MYIIKQLSVFVENKLGGIFEILDILTENGINIEALSVSESSDYGIMRMTTDDNRTAALKLSESGIIVKCTDVIAVPIENVPGGLSKLLLKLKDAGIAVDYLYAFIARNSEGARVVIKTADPCAALDALGLKEPDQIK